MGVYDGRKKIGGIGMGSFGGLWMYNIMLLLVTGAMGHRDRNTETGYLFSVYACLHDKWTERIVLV